MPQPPVVEGLPNPLIELYRRVWESVVLEQERIIADPLRFRRRARLTEIRQAIERELDLLELPTRRWLQMQFPRSYALGTANGVGGAVTGWTSIDRDAVEELANGLFSDLLGATQHVKDSTKELIRAVMRDEALQQAIEGRTATQAAREAARRLVDDHGVHAVVYANGAKHGLSDYAEMSLRTTTALGYNTGTVNGMIREGIRYAECFDGFDCGLVAHNDTQKANGMVLDVDTARTYLIAHPRCQRAWGPRPDITTANEAKVAEASTTAAQRADQMRVEQERADAVQRRAARRRQRVARASGPDRMRERLGARRDRIRS